QIWRCSFRRSGRDDPIENQPDILHVLFQCRVEISYGIERHTPRQSVDDRAILRKSMGLLFRFDLQPMFDRSQKSISSIKIDNLFARDELEPGERAQCI